MTYFSRYALIAAGLALALVACKPAAAPAEETTHVSPSAAVPPATSARSEVPAAMQDPLAAIQGSFAAVAALDSGRAEFSWQVKRSGYDLKGSGTYIVQAPGRLQIDEHYQGQGTVPSKFGEQNDSTIQLEGNSAFLKTPSLGKDWIVFTPAEMGTDWGVLQSLLAARSPLDLSLVSSKLGLAVTFVGMEPISGRTYAHLHTEVDAGTLAEALADAYGGQGQIIFVGRYSGPVPFDVWVEPDTLLPRRVTADGTISFLSADTRFQIAVDYTELGKLSKFPDAPKSAKKVSELR